ncbi:hypothetical protein JM79_2194 [Gramella sp. Hel_I_59]|uniref:hypothetical protein n=1 Tax=Gramella sp. Hel_I_59 TaxID=1249978 RepID=UPI00114F2DD5|nr:hypothetical protein [Gramella sp. Hel_I_59]TQI71267.1 hypothetical protein JM79_2194 [Gramella sp. Hel_I_59]
MELDFCNDEEFDKRFLSASKELLSAIKQDNSTKSLEKIKFHKLDKLAEDLSIYSPVDDIRKEKKLLIEYLNTLNSNSISSYSFRELLEMERDYILPSIDGKLRETGYTTNYVWFFASLMILPLDILLAYFFGEYYFYIPFFTLYIAISSLSDRRKAKRERKLW